MIIADKDETNIEFPVNSNNLEKLENVHKLIVKEFGQIPQVKFFVLDSLC